MDKISRRDFMKLSGAFAAGLTLPGAFSHRSFKSAEKPNIIIILCDALSAAHMSLYGYSRKTTPNIERFSERSVVYHNHYSGGNYTTTGTASMLTGMHAWKHRALNFGGLINRNLAAINPYSLLDDSYYKLAFSQNIWPDRMVGQFHHDVDRFLASVSFSILHDGPLVRNYFSDPVLDSIGVKEFLLSPQGAANTGTSLFGYVNKTRYLSEVEMGRYHARYPKGIPEVQMRDGYIIPYFNEVLFAGIYSEIMALNEKPAPFFAYFHVYSPHSPYRPRANYRELFRDDYMPVSKPQHHFSENVNEYTLLTNRTLYDRQVAQIDDEFGKLIARLDEQGVLDNSYVIFTSDHGELFERGYVGHGNQLMYEPVIHIPLVIHSPGQTSRKDVRTLTSNIDLLPTILALSGSAPSSEVDGLLLPEFGGEQDDNRVIFSMIANENSSFAPIKKAVLAMRKHQYKLIAYLGYPDGFDDRCELYDLESDPDELQDLSGKEPLKLSQMKEELFTRLNAANQSLLNP